MISEKERRAVVKGLGGSDLAEDCLQTAILEFLLEGQDPSFSLVWSRAKSRLVDYLRSNQMELIGGSVWTIPDKAQIPDYPDIPDDSIPDYVIGLDGKDTLSAIAVLCASRSGSRVDSLTCSEARECSEHVWKRAYRGRLARAIDRRQVERFHQTADSGEHQTADSGQRTRVFYRHVWSSPDSTYPHERNDGNREAARWLLDSRDFYATQILGAISASCEIDRAIRAAYWELSPPVRRVDYRPVKRVSTIPLSARWFYDNEDIYSSKSLIRTEWASYGDGELETSLGKSRQERIMQPSFPLSRLDRYGYWT